MGISIKQYSFVHLVYGENETEAVKIAIANLQRDLRRVLDVRINENANAPYSTIKIGTVGAGSDAIKEADISLIRDENGKLKREAFLIQEKDNTLLIVGADTRGTIYGIYDFCQWIGVSPWYFWADVPIKKKAEIIIPDNYMKTDFPSVEYRGIFINDEEELEHWVQRYMGEPTIGVKTYEYVFELLLRLKLNYIWPAMHVNSFNQNPENGALANKMGIIVGTSHCDMLMRSNNREWKPWLKSKGYSEKEVEYDYSIPGKNREILEEYWRESIEQNKNFEVTYTLGMRGIHDSGFETKSLAEKTGKELLNAKVELLDSVIESQEQMLKNVLGEQKEPLKIFVPYKEVLELYDNGLEVPEDLTLIWVNDNYGYIRRYPDAKEKQRKSGNGIYYHNSYWAPPGGSYLFICSIPHAHTRNELKKAYDEGIQKLWVTNFGAMKPLEQQMTYYASLAWEVGKENALTNDEQLFLENWINETFSGNHGKELAPVLIAFDQLTNTRKLEQMDIDVFSQTAYGDEAVERIHKYEEMFIQVNEIYETLPKEEKDAFFQLFMMKIHAAYYTNIMYYYADRSNLCIKQGKTNAAKKYTALSELYDEARRQMLYYYNNIMANGKWNGILTPEDFPPPRTAMYPACKPPIGTEKEKGLIVTVWNDDDTLTFVADVEPYCSQYKWIEVASASKENIEYEIHTPDWINLESAVSNTESNTVSIEERILISLNQDKLKEWQEEQSIHSLKGEIIIDVLSEDCILNADNLNSSQKIIPIQVVWIKPSTSSSKRHYEVDGRICIEAAKAREMNGDSWEVIPNLGRSKGSLIQVKKDNTSGILKYDIFVNTPGKHLLEIHRYPSLNSVGRIRVGVSVDGGEIYTVESKSNDEHCGQWKQNVRNNVDKLLMELPMLEKGKHSIEFTAIDAYFAFFRCVIYTKEKCKNNLGLIQKGNQALPMEWDIKSFTKYFYGENKLIPRPEIYLPITPAGDTLTMEDIMLRHEKSEKSVTPMEIMSAADTIFLQKKEHILIDAACAWANTANAYIYPESGVWDYCNSPAYNGNGLALYIRDERNPMEEEAKNIPTLNYRIKVLGGEYKIWIHTHLWGTDTCRFTVGTDGEKVPIKELYNGHEIWRYSLEQVWAWIPIHTLKLTEGEHIFTIYDMSARTRFDSIYITTGDELPPIR